ncbi:hypothetical protein AVT69_gp030 [Pseudomonas phage PhiPA3]|uniref:Uncharacterized protein 029 n=1 Tax=Pseudomonas phage PhiPA3 TaxID=998086 RepID=F8SJR1_BPPA3|nr:hypothetical protein AVT69_gp030 [Pseudomonas phage PhiPA3]AEH03456.1 hypothetical protein [Pseudomonas phage PhiPA3]
MLDIFVQRELRTKIENILWEEIVARQPPLSIQELIDRLNMGIDRQTLESFLIWHYKSPGRGNIIKDLIWMIKGETPTEIRYGFPPLRFMQHVLGHEYSYHTPEHQLCMNSWKQRAREDYVQQYKYDSIISDNVNRFISSRVKE